ncbi:Photosystem II reaction center PSB28 protein, chloroplastic [Capsicum chinense]|nr:Photosystem II reaction center PSB28 protein, chloroplastic [Capsicum chinense]
MATLQSLAFSPTLSHTSHQPRSLLGIACGRGHQSAGSSFNGQRLCLSRSCFTSNVQNQKMRRLTIMMVQPKIQFIQGTDEQTIPDVKLTKSRDGTNGMAIFRFDQPSVFDSSGEVGDITGFYMIDEEGVLSSVDVNAKFVNGKPAGIEAKYIMRTPREWDRFMRFMERMKGGHMTLTVDAQGNWFGGMVSFKGVFGEAQPRSTCYGDHRITIVERKRRKLVA